MTAFSGNDFQDVRDMWRSAPIAELEELVGTAPILIMAPHADDETIGCGGLIQAAVRKGLTIAVDILTDGSRSHPNSRTHDRRAMTTLREGEALRAAASLGLRPAALRFWRVEDSTLEATAYHVDRACRRIAEVGAKTVFVTWIDDPHRDHKAAFAIARRAVARCGTKVTLMAYPVWSWTVAKPRNPLQLAASRLDLSDDLVIKRRALSCHASQLGHVVTDDPNGFALSEADLALFMQPWEVFLTVTRGEEGGS